MNKYAIAIAGAIHLIPKDLLLNYLKDPSIDVSDHVVTDPEMLAKIKAYEESTKAPELSDETLNKLRVAEYDPYDSRQFLDTSNRDPMFDFLEKKKWKGKKKRFS